MIERFSLNQIGPTENEGSAWSPPDLFKYASLERVLDILQTGEIRFTQPRFLNDPHELSVEINPQSLLRSFYEHMVASGVEAERAADVAKRNLKEVVIDAVERVVVARESLGILALCDRPDNMLLWAHYGNEHRGAALQLDVSNLITPLKTDDEIQALAEVKYTDERVDYIARRLPLWMTLAYKSAAWAYEREWRVVKSLSALRKKTDKVYVFDLPPSAIKRVIFGARAEGPFEEAAIKFLQESADHRHIKIEKAIFSSGLVGLDFRTGHDFAWSILHGQHHFGDHWRELRQWVDLSKMEQAENGEGLPPIVSV